MAGNKQPKQRKRNAGSGKSRLKRNVTSKKMGSAHKFSANTGMVWPQIHSKQNAIQLSLQFTFQVSEWWSHDRLLVNQLRQITALVRHAAATVPYYRKKLHDLPLPSLHSLTWDDFRTLPLTRRADIQSAGKALVSEAIPGNHGPVFEIRSSGSTGRPIRVSGTGLTSIYGLAFTTRSHLWHRRDLSAKNFDIRTVNATEKPKERRTWSVVPGAGESVRIDINLPINVLLDQLIREDPVYMQTHPYTLKGMIKNSVERGIRPKSLREVRTFGEALEPDIRDAARAHWGIEIVDGYSAMEVGVIALQCPESENLHVQSESVLLEILDDYGRPCLPGEVGRVVITALHNFATPLIRYEIGDFAEVGETCACGRGLPVLTRVLGRQRNFVTLPSGEKRFPEAWAKLTDIAPEIRQFQLTQKSLEKIEVKLVVAAPLTNSKELQLAQYLIEKFGHPFDYQFVYVNDIPRGENGKFEEFISEVL